MSRCGSGTGQGGPGTQHLLPLTTHTDSQGAAWLGSVPTCLLLHGDAVYLAYYPMFAYKHRESTRRRGGHERRGEARQGTLFLLLLLSLLQLGWDYPGTRGGPASPVPNGDQRRCSQGLCEETQHKERLEREKSRGAPDLQLAQSQAFISIAIDQAAPGSHGKRCSACHQQQLSSALPLEHNMVTPA